MRYGRISWASGLAGILLATMLATATAAYAQSSNADAAASGTLTTYLRDNRLPLVGASVSHPSPSSTQVLLYGYTATEAGKNDAALKTQEYFHNFPEVTIINRISDNPEIRTLGQGSGSASVSPPVPVYGQSGNGGLGPGELSWEKVYDSIQRYGVHPAPDSGTGLVP
jgi:hypothetical protein